MRNWIVMGVLIAFIIISFLIFGEKLTSFFEEGKAVQFLEQYGQWAWLIAIILLMADLILPLPGTIIMSALGLIYGPVIGGILATFGNFLAGVFAYTLCRSIGDKAVLWLLGEKDLNNGHKIFEQRGGWIVALSRWLPILPEAISCMAGLNRMHFSKFVIALTCGSLPLGFAFAYICYYGIEEPLIAIMASAVLPFIFWIIAQYWIRKVANIETS